MPKNETKFAGVMDAVRHYVDTGAMTVKQLASWCGRDERTIYYWLAGQGEPSSRDVNLWLQRMPDEPRLHVAVAQLSGSGLHVTTSPEQDGAVCLLERALAAVKQTAELAGTVNDAHADRSVTAAERERIRAEAVQARSLIDDIIAATEPAGLKLRVV